MNKLVYQFKLLLLKDKKDKELFMFLCDTLGFFPKDLYWYKQSFIHKSSTQSYKLGCNERLEYLGDAILASIVANYLFERFPNEREGFLTNMRSKIVNRNTMNKIGLELKLQRHLLSQIPNLRQNDAIGNCLEALIGAMYKDSGYQKTRMFIEEKIILPHINDKNLPAPTDQNYKSLLQQYCQKNKIVIEYKTGQLADEKKPTFKTELYANGVLVTEGKGRSKKLAEQAASKNALNQKKLLQKIKNKEVENKPQEEA